MEYKPAWLSNITHTHVFAAAIGVATVLAFGLAGVLHLVLKYPPLSPQWLKACTVNPYDVGYAVQSLFVPVILIYAFSRTDFFRKLISDPPSHQETRKLGSWLAAIQTIAVVYFVGIEFLTGGHGTVLGYVLIVFGGLLGGWRIGLGLSLFTLFLRATLSLLISPHQELVLLWQGAGTGSLLNISFWGILVFKHFLACSWGIPALWAGLGTGLYAEILNERRLIPPVAFWVGLIVDLGGSLLSSLLSENPKLFFNSLIPNFLVSAFVMTTVALIVRSVLAEVSQRRVEAAELARTQSELRALRAQINPHFLFNALNTIRYFVRIDPEAARSLLLSLSEVFQRALRAGEFVQLRSEISYVEAYLSLEKARLDKRLRVVWVVQGVEGQVQDSPLFEYTVPTLILQPIVENAIIHGVAKKPEGGIVRIGIDQADGHLLLQVSDTGVGMSPERITEILGPDQSKTSSIGLRNVDRRLRVLYGEEFRIEIQSEPKRGTWVQIKLPLETRQAGSFELRGRFDSLPKFRVTEPKIKL